MKIRIGIDVRMRRHTGIGTYISGLLSGFDQLGLIEGLEVCPQSFGAPIYSIREQWDYARLVPQFHLWHAPHYNVPVFNGRAKLVVTVHDLIHWIFRKEYFNPLQRSYAGIMFRQTVRKADRVIAVSEKTKQDLVHYFKAKPEKISVIYEGIGQSFTANSNSDQVSILKKKYRLPESFFLYVGMIKRHKNVPWLVNTCRDLIRNGKMKSGLVVIGKKDEKFKEGMEMINRIRQEKRIQHIPYVETEELTAFYQSCTALIHPSLYEGFGLTPLEAMACGAPVIALRAAGSIPEVLGRSAHLINPTAEELADAIYTLENNESMRLALSQKGRAHAARFRWVETARKTAEVYRKVLAV